MREPLSDKSNGWKEIKTAMNLFSCIVHELVVRTTEYFPVTREGGVWDDEVTCRVAIGVSYLSVVDADPVSLRGLGVQKSKPFPKMAG